jgi:O-antigen/teichoic acid export membrane protein
VSTTPATDEAHDGDDRTFVKRRLIVNTGASIATNLWAILVSIAVIPVLIGGLGLESFGIWALLLTFSALTGWFSLADIGVGVASSNAVAAARAAHDGERQRVLVSTTIWYFLAIGAASAALFIVGGALAMTVSSFEPSEPGTNLALAITYAALQVGVDLASRSFLSILDGMQRVDLSRLLDAVRRTLVAAFAGIAAATAGTLQAAMGAAFIASLLSAALSAIVAHRKAGCSLASPSIAVVAELIRAGITIGLLRPLGVIHRTMDRIIVGVVIGPRAVGGVEVAASLQNGIDAILSASSNPVTPSASYLHAKRDIQGLERVFTRGTRYSLLATIPAGVFVVMLSPQIIDVWIGADAPEGSAALARLGGLATMVMAVAAVGSNLLVGIGAARVVLVAASVSVVINLTLSIWLAQTWGPEGVFTATLISSLVLTPMIIVPCVRITSASRRGFIRRSVIPGFAPGFVLVVVISGVVAVLQSSVWILIVSAVVGALATAVSTYAIGLDRPERAAIREFIGSRMASK